MDLKSLLVVIFFLVLHPLKIVNIQKRDIYIRPDLGHDFGVYLELDLVFDQILLLFLFLFLFLPSWNVVDVDYGRVTFYGPGHVIDFAFFLYHVTDFGVFLEI